MRKRRGYRRWCEEERRKHEKEEEKLEGIRMELENWKYINKFRKKRNDTDNTIEIRE